jgi:hypothetical protein
MRRFSALALVAMFTLLQQSTKNILHRVSPAVWTSMIHINDVAWLACDCD